ncbi:MAG: histidine kinase [Janthinobacterium lividum]
MNPHFMFNSLNNIWTLILEDHQKVRLMLTKFSKLLRYSLQHSEEKETTVEGELDILNQYINLIKLQ